MGESGTYERKFFWPLGVLGHKLADRGYDLKYPRIVATLWDFGYTSDKLLARN